MSQTHSNKSKFSSFYILNPGDLDWLNYLEMLEDVRISLLDEIRTNEDLLLAFYNFLYQGFDAEELITDQLEWGIKPNHNLAIEIFGPQRHGKSIVARELARRIKQYNANIKIVFGYDYEQMSKIIQSVVQELEQQVIAENPNLSELEIAKLVIQRLHGYVFIQDEKGHLHGKGSVKREHAIENLIDMVGFAGVNFILISPSPRGSFNSYFKLRVLGYHPETKQNLVIYYNRNNKPIAVTLLKANIDEFDDDYETEKILNVYRVLKVGGLLLTEEELSVEKNGLSTDQDSTIQSTEFNDLLRHYIKKELERTGINRVHIPRFITYYFSEQRMTIKDVRSLLGEESLSEQAIHKSIKECEKRLSNKALGNALEYTLKAYIESHLPTNPPSAADAEAAVRVAVVRDWKDEVTGQNQGYDIAVVVNGEPILVVNTKMFMGQKQEVLRARPEFLFPGPKYILVVTPNPIRIWLKEITGEYMGMSGGFVGKRALDFLMQRIYEVLGIDVEREGAQEKEVSNEEKAEEKMEK